MNSLEGNPAEVYEHFLVPNLFRPWAELILARAADLRGRHILDVATGTGIVARLAAVAVGVEGEVTGLDINPAMLTVAAVQKHPIGAAPIRWIEADALAMPLPAAAFERMFCLEGTQFFPDRAAGFAEMHRVLAPGGILVTSNWGPLSENPGYHAVSDGLRAFVSEEAARLPPMGLTDPDEIAGLAQAAGFTSARVEPVQLTLPVPSAREFVAWIAAGGPSMRHSLALLSEERREDFLRFVEARLAQFAFPEGGLALPSLRHILTATRLSPAPSTQNR